MHLIRYPCTWKLGRILFQSIHHDYSCFSVLGLDSLVKLTKAFDRKSNKGKVTLGVIISNTVFVEQDSICGNLMWRDELLNTSC